MADWLGRLGRQSINVDGPESLVDKSVKTHGHTLDRVWQHRHSWAVVSSLSRVRHCQGTQGSEVALDQRLLLRPRPSFDLAFARVC